MVSNFVHLMKELQGESKEINQNIRKKFATILTSQNLENQKLFRKSYTKETTELFTFDLSNQYGLPKNSCLYKGDNLWRDLILYDCAVVYLFPTSKNQFSYYHPFSVADFDSIIRLNKEGRIILHLVDYPIAYSQFEYMQDLFEECHPIHYEGTTFTLMQNDAYDSDYAEMVDQITERPQVVSAINRHVEKGKDAGDDFKKVETNIINTIYNLKLYGYDFISNKILTSLPLVPDIALDHTYAARALILLPIEDSYGIPTGMEIDDFTRCLYWVSSKPRLDKLEFPAEIGSVVFDKIKYPAPNDYESFQWMEDSLDLDILKAVYRDLAALVLRKVEVTEIPEYIAQAKEIATEGWEINVHRVKRKRKMIFWETSILVGVLGTISTGSPIAGLLSSLGVTISSNLFVEPIVDFLTKKSVPAPAFHFYKAERRITK